MNNFIVDDLIKNDLVYKPVQYWKKDSMRTKLPYYRASGLLMQLVLSFSGKASKCERITAHFTNEW